MKKNNGWIWLLGGAVWVTLGTISVMSSPQYDVQARWPFAAVAAALLWAAAFVVRKMVQKDDAENAARWQAAADEKRQRQEETERVRQQEAEERRIWRENHPTVVFPVAGVTFTNEDKTDRQKILHEISFNDFSRTDVWFDEDEELGDESAIRVLTDYGCVGYIRRSDKDKVRRFFDKKVYMKYLEVEHFTNDEGRSIYRADVVIRLDREDPEQRWYFDALQK